MQNRPPALDSDSVRDFVLNAHRDLDAVKTMLADEPALVNASWDWGGGDWETALNAAAHTGQRDIAEWLLAKGARLDIYAAAMLGWLDVVKMMIAAHPASVNTPGAHGIPLIAHAQQGGVAAQHVVDYLQTLDTCNET